SQLIPLSRLKTAPALAALALVQKASRLSVMPVDAAQWVAVLALR
ncbi:MAG TPA: EVE domain-containing protein, partial [Pseudomonas sp.]|nr:EVE domain-containing protein [Pseudomonas sp.]